MVIWCLTSQVLVLECPIKLNFSATQSCKDWSSAARVAYVFKRSLIYRRLNYPALPFQACRPPKSRTLKLKLCPPPPPSSPSERRWKSQMLLSVPSFHFVSSSAVAAAAERETECRGLESHGPIRAPARRSVGQPRRRRQRPYMCHAAFSVSTQQDVEWLVTCFYLVTDGHSWSLLDRC